ncbi:MAG: sialidase family protein, partial [Promethearchaeota archaeon]
MSKVVFERQVIFKAGDGGYFCYRIPALICTKKGTLIAFAEARQYSCSDWAPSAIVSRRCLDPVGNLDIWEAPTIVHKSSRIIEPKSWPEVLLAGRYAEDMGWDQESDDFKPAVPVCTNNPVPIVDEVKDLIHFVHCEHYDRVFYSKSVDDGETWSKPKEITDVLEEFRNEYDWTVVASGPGHSVQISDGPFAGRLIVPFWFASNKDDPSAHRPSRVGIIYSDDHGSTWERGDLVPNSGVKNPSETMAVQLSNNKILINARNEGFTNDANPAINRVYSISKDGAHDWAPFKPDVNLPEPICMGSIIRFNQPKLNGKNVIVFS